MKLLFLTALCIVSVPVLAQQDAIAVPKDTASVNTKIFAQSIVEGTNDNYEKAKTLLSWLSNHFEWKATDYQQRTVKEIIVRQGGNCFELATV